MGVGLRGPAVGDRAPWLAIELGAEGCGGDALELVVLRLQRLQALGVRHVHAAELGLPGVVARLRKPVLAAQLLDRQAGVGLTQEANDLLLCESLLHRPISSQG